MFVSDNKEEKMANLSYLFHVGQKVFYKNTDFDAVRKFIPCVVKSVHDDHVMITDLETNTDLWIEEKLNIDCVYSENNFDIPVINKK